jgi:hypothetical protein
MTRILGLLLLIMASAPACADPTSPIRLEYLEGDYAGATTIWSEDGERVIGHIAYRQHRLPGDILRMERIAHFADGSRDEDKADVRVGKHLEAVGGRSIIRDTAGTATVDLRIDVEGRRVRGFYLDDGEKIEFDAEVDIGPGTYWGPMFMLVVKNFATNAVDDTVVVQSVLATPKPRVLAMEFARDGTASLRRSGGSTDTARITLLPTIHFLIDPIVQRLVPKTHFYVDDGKPPSLARFQGPRNYAGQMIRIE